MYNGTVNSNGVTPGKTSLTGIGNITITWYGTTPVLTSGAVSPSGATVTYQWQSYSGSSWNNIPGATSSTYAGTLGTQYCVTATGTGSYTGTVISDEITAEKIALESIGDIVVSWDGANPVLTAGAVFPAGATVTYQWHSYSRTSWNNISGATSSSYAGTLGTQYRVTATGTGTYTETVSSGSVTPNRIRVTAVGSITRSNYTLYPGAVTPSGATVTYQWQRQERTWNNRGSYWSSWSEWSNIGTGSICAYTADTKRTKYQYQLIVTGTGQYYDSATSPNYPS